MSLGLKVKLGFKHNYLDSGRIQTEAQNPLSASILIIRVLLVAGTWTAPLGPLAFRPRPTDGFAFSKIDQHRALMFGGRTSQGRMNEGFIFDLDDRVKKKLCFFKGFSKTYTLVKYSLILKITIEYYTFGWTSLIRLLLALTIATVYDW